MPKNYLILAPKPGQADAPEDKFGIAHGSGIVAEESGPETLVLHYEGNIYGACNLGEFEQRILSAAGRKAYSYPTAAMMALPKTVAEENFVVVGELDYTACETRLRARKMTYATDAACVRESVTYRTENPEAARAYLAWVGSPMPGSEKPPEPVLEVHTILIASEGPPPISILEALQKAAENGEIKNALIRRSPEEDRANIGKDGEFWAQTPAKTREAETRHREFRERAEEAFLKETEGLQVVDTDGWEETRGGGKSYLSRAYYVQDPGDPGGESLRHTFEYAENR